MPNLSRRGFLTAAGATVAAALLASGSRPMLAGATVTFTTIQAALDAAWPGDVVEIPDGHYHENIVFPRSGTAAAPITLRAATGAHVIIDGADPQLQTTNTRWSTYRAATSTSPAVYHATVPFAGADPTYSISSWASRTGAPGRNGCDRLLAAYASLQVLLDDRPRGEGTYRDGDDVYVVLDGGDNPNNVGLNVGLANSVLNLNGHSHIRISDIEIRNGGWAGIYLPGPQEFDPDDPLSGPDIDRHVDVQIADVTVRNCFRQISVGKAQDLVIERVRLLAGVVQDWVWAGAYDAGIGRHPSTKSDILAPWRGYGMQLTRVNGGEISDSLIAGQWDGFGLKRCVGVDIHHCTVHNIMDDGIELESPEQSDIAFHSNHLYDVCAGISFTVNYPGPIHVYRNVVEATHPGGRGYSPSYTLKSGQDDATARAENIKFYHNTLIAPTTYNVWEKLDDASEDRWNGYDFVNNVMWSGTTVAGRGNYNFRGRGAEDNGGDNHWEGNVYNISVPVGQAPLVWSDGDMVNAVAPWQSHYNAAPDYMLPLGSFAVPATGGATAGTEYVLASAELAAFLESARNSGKNSVTFVVREDALQSSTISFVSKEDTAMAPTALSLVVGPTLQQVQATLEADTYVLNSDPWSNRGSETRIHVRHTASADFRRLSYLRFDISDADAAVSAAELTFRLGNISSGRISSNIQIYGVDPAYVPGDDEPGAITLPALSDEFTTFAVSSREVPRDLTLVSGSVLRGAGSTYAYAQSWPDDVDVSLIPVDPGAWQSGAVGQQIGAPHAVLTL